jgi:hypothetical protein
MLLRFGNNNPYISSNYDLGRRARYITAACITLSLIAVADSSYAAGRVFYDGFESGTTNQWSQDDFRNKCNVVSSALDGGAGPRGGTKMVRCNWNGTLDWNDPARYEALRLGSWNYSREFLIRFWIREDRDLGSPKSDTGPKYYRLGSNENGPAESFGALNVGGFQKAEFYNAASQIGGTYWGDGSSVGDRGWHKVEIYIKNGTSDGVVRLWEDDAKVWESVNVNTVQSGGTWTPFFISSNWSGAAGCCDHDTSNHIYWDDFEIYSDTASGATGLLSDGSISVSGGEVSLNPPMDPPLNMRVVE